ncbi:MAG: energy transducer TonB [Desulfobacteraceae bacterium]|nr:MAG: energy transducer TonB [Desulfobacteraceae bacterium]
MKRFLFPMGLTLAIHGLFLGAGGDWLKERIPYRPRPAPIALTLSYQQPKKTVVPPVKLLEKPSSPPVTRLKEEKKPEPIKKKPQSKQVIVKPPKKIRKPLKKAPKKIDSITKLSKSLPPEPKDEIQSKVVRAPPPLSEPELFFGNQDQQLKEDYDLFPETIDEAKQKVFLDEKEPLASVPSAQIIREAVPVYRKNPPPQYPRVARRRGYQGTIVLEVLVNREGRVEKLKVFQSSGYSVLDKSAIRSVKGWLFEPGRRGDEKVEMWVKLPVRFKLKE